MLQLSSPLCWCNTFASSATGCLVEIKNIVESYCLFSKEKKRTESMSEREGKGKAETWAHKPDVEDKGRLCFTSFIPSTNKRLITVLSLNCKICFVCSTANFFPRVTQLLLFLKNSFCWCSDQAFKPRWNLYNNRLSFCPHYTFWHFRSTYKGILT